MWNVIKPFKNPQSHQTDLEPFYKSMCILQPSLNIGFYCGVVPYKTGSHNSHTLERNRFQNIIWFILCLNSVILQSLKVCRGLENLGNNPVSYVNMLRLVWSVLFYAFFGIGMLRNGNLVLEVMKH